MRMFTISILLLAVVAMVGYSLGWFTVNSASHDGSTTYSVTIDKVKWQLDRDEYRNRAEARLKEMDKKIEGLQAQMMRVPTEARESLARTIDDLRQQERAVRDELAHPPAATQERWEAIKTKVSQAFDDLEQGLQKAWSRFKSS